MVVAWTVPKRSICAYDAACRYEHTFDDTMNVVIDNQALTPPGQAGHLSGVRGSAKVVFCRWPGYKGRADGYYGEDQGYHAVGPGSSIVEKTDKGGSGRSDKETDEGGESRCAPRQVGEPVQYPGEGSRSYQVGDRYSDHCAGDYSRQAAEVGLGNPKEYGSRSDQQGGTDPDQASVTDPLHIANVE